MSKARITIKGWSIECSGHNYITLYYDGRFVHCYDNDLHFENSSKDEYYTEHIIASIEKRTKMKITDIPIIGCVEDFDGRLTLDRSHVFKLEEPKKKKWRFWK